jgi:hypothetical protein
MKRVLVGILLAGTAHAGRPLVVDDAGTVEVRHFEWEAGWGFVRDGATKHGDFPVSLTYGVTQKLEAGVGFGGQIERLMDAAGQQKSESDWGDLFLGAKWNPLSADRWWAEHAVAFTVKFPTADEDKGMGSGEMDYDLTYILTKGVGARVNVDFNIGYTWAGGDDDFLHYGLAGRWQLLERVELVGEVFAQTPFPDTCETSVSMNAGARWRVIDSLVWDAAAGAGLNGNAPDWTATTGLTWTFGFGRKTGK